MATTTVGATPMNTGLILTNWMGRDPRSQLCLWSRCVRPCSIPLIKWMLDHYALEPVGLKDELIPKLSFRRALGSNFSPSHRSATLSSPFWILGEERIVNTNGLKASLKDWRSGLNFIFILHNLLSRVSSMDSVRLSKLERAIREEIVVICDRSKNQFNQIRSVERHVVLRWKLCT